ncbi:MAG: insulinase family protein, partial [Bacteroidales bacterium]|nr:insulinase family protein [Bacteroidales bacterium]
MKHYSLVIILTIISIFCSAQQENLQLIVPQSKSKAQLKSSNKMDKNSEFNNQYKLETFVLDNGLTVYLNEDKNVPNIIGAVVIKTGGKYDPANATGTSHYLEHMMFKGNEIIGTTNYNEEKLILDEISKKYDELGKITDNEERKKIQKEINELSIKAGEFAIPNDLDKILDEIGSTFVNAFTSDEIVAYFNIFPSSQINKWLNVYSTRFQKPVFRLFQSELETVFEEKNMYADNMQTAIIENFYKNFYKNHPYGTQTVIGKPEHIKNPSQSTMQKMYDTYYVANNMALVLCGNFNSEEIKPLINKYFNDWRKGEIPKYPVYEEKPFNGEEIVKTRLAPIKLGIMGFRTVPNNSKDEIGLEICSALLNNSSETGL